MKKQWAHSLVVFLLVLSASIGLCKIAKLAGITVVKSYLNTLGNEMDNLQVITPTSIIEACFETVDLDSVDFYKGTRGPDFIGIDDYLSNQSSFSAIDKLDFSTPYKKQLGQYSL